MRKTSQEPFLLKTWYHRAANRRRSLVLLPYYGTILAYVFISEKKKFVNVAHHIFA
jgi:hypothetical protein